MTEAEIVKQKEEIRLKLFLLLGRRVPDLRISEIYVAYDGQDGLEPEKFILTLRGRSVPFYPVRPQLIGNAEDYLAGDA